MPTNKFIVLKKAAEIIEVMKRIQLISDISAAFSGDKEHYDGLKKLYNSLNGTLIVWTADPDWQERLSKYQR